MYFDRERTRVEASKSSESGTSKVIHNYVFLVLVSSWFHFLLVYVYDTFQVTWPN